MVTPRARHSGASAKTVCIDNTHKVAPSISISGLLSKQVCSMLDHSSRAESEPAICAFMLGYIEGDGSISLNRLDQGILSQGQRIPTAMYASDMVVPIYRGGGKEQFYATVVIPSCVYNVAAWVSGNKNSKDNVGCPLVEFVTVNYRVGLSLSLAPNIDIVSLPELLTHLQQNADACWGPLNRLNSQPRYEHGLGPLTPPAHAIWSASDSRDQIAIVDAFVAAGAPWSLHVAQISSADDYQTAQIQHIRASPIEGEYKILVRLGAAQLSASSNRSTVAVRLLPLAQHNSQAPRMLATITASAGTLLTEQVGDRSVALSALACSPLLQNIAASTLALTERKSLVPSTGSHPRALGYPGDDHMAELLKEQRNIRALLEEQNQLMKVHVSQTQELMRMTRHQPSPQTITRRHLRVKGTYTPTLLGHQPPTTSTAVAGPLSARRSNSLSEIVDGIRSFEVEGYEETEHSARPANQFATTSASSSGSIGISNLVSRIHHIVNDTAGSGTAAKPFARPPLPAYSNKPTLNRDLVHVSKITPTTQKYLDSLNQQHQQQRRASSS